MDKKKWIAGAIILCLLGGGGYWYSSSQTAVEETQQQIKTVAVQRGDVKTEVSATGALSAVRSIEISSKVTGRITEMRVEENQHVQAGEVLAVLDSRALQQTLEQLRVKMDVAQANYKRAEELVEIGGYSIQQLDTARENYEVARTNYESKLADLGDYTITTPISGIVIGKPLEEGQTVVQGISAAQVMMKIADLTEMQIEADVDETDIGKVKVGQNVTFTIDTYSGKTFTGTVTKISNQSTTTNNVIYYTVYVAVHPTNYDLKPDMTARLVINTNERHNVLYLPNEAVKVVNGQATVQVLEKGKQVTKNVTTGLSGEMSTEIVDGLSEGDEVVLPTKKTKTRTPMKMF
ncbi:MAG: efflux RND transporter periplasmic adaptor subunit [Selenomonadales bacterium]|jgi:HlyD family secretion protein|nr:efflux RND transporter periplasmic adaptor subunit [Selenomonadales bacterium]MBQ5587585.1 efflux RND transporter periplasmic adaptor subunit [Selenomonadales bacterium]MBQ5636504.1 efflux RND transporter periplasmic adaptor subunit [Selenomonadales bacterium]MBQ5859592.1 efflux RND transporter periplasmic adaptor subunit [Selenomonadales bacterium]